MVLTAWFRVVVGAVVVAMLGCGDVSPTGGGLPFDPSSTSDGIDTQPETTSPNTADTGTSDSPTGQGPETTGGATSTSTSGTSLESSSSAESSAEGSSSATGGQVLDPPAGASSGGAGGGPASGQVRTTPTGVTYRVVAPGDAGPLPAMVVYSGTEGGDVMASNLVSFGGSTGNAGTVFVVLDGVQYNGNAQAGADALDDARDAYNIDNDRTYLLSESAGTSAGLELGFSLRQSYFAAYWVNDVNAQAAPAQAADALGFAPWGNAGPGGDFSDANAIVAGMQTAGYRIEDPAPYDGPGAQTHGDIDQFTAALSWFPGRTRQ